MGIHCRYCSTNTQRQRVGKRQTARPTERRWLTETEGIDFPTALVTPFQLWRLLCRREWATFSLRFSRFWNVKEAASAATELHCVFTTGEIWGVGEDGFHCNCSMTTTIPSLSLFSYLSEQRLQDAKERIFLLIKNTVRRVCQVHTHKHTHRHRYMDSNAHMNTQT